MLPSELRNLQHYLSSLKSYLLFFLIFPFSCSFLDCILIHGYSYFLYFHDIDLYSSLNNFFSFSYYLPTLLDYFYSCYSLFLNIYIYIISLYSPIIFNLFSTQFIVPPIHISPTRFHISFLFSYSFKLFFADLTWSLFYLLTNSIVF